MQQKRLILWVAVAQLVLMGLIGARLWWRSVEAERTIQAQIERDRRVWGSGEFIDIGTGPDFRDAVADALAEAFRVGPKPSDEMLGALAGALSQALQAFSTGDEASYRRFHFPVDSQTRGEFNEPRMEIIRKAALQDAGFSAGFDVGSATDEDLFVAWGRHLVEVFPDRMKSCQQCWRRVSLEKLRVRYDQVIDAHDVERSLELLSAPSQFDEWRGTVSVFKSVISYTPDCDDLLSEFGEVHIVTVRTPIMMTAGAVGVYPMYMKLYWSPADRVWIPLGLCAPTSETNVRVWF